MGITERRGGKGTGRQSEAKQSGEKRDTAEQVKRQEMGKGSQAAPWEAVT